MLAKFETKIHFGKLMITFVNLRSILFKYKVIYIKEEKELIIHTYITIKYKEYKYLKFLKKTEEEASWAGSFILILFKIGWKTVCSV